MLAHAEQQQGWICEVLQDAKCWANCNTGAPLDPDTPEEDRCYMVNELGIHQLTVSKVTSQAVRHQRMFRFRRAVPWGDRAMSTLAGAGAAKHFLLGWPGLWVVVFGSATLILVLGCGPTKPAGNGEQGRAHLTRQDLIEGPEWSSIQSLAVVGDSILVVLDPRSEPFLTAIAVRRPGTRTPFGRSGDGPGELRSPVGLEADGGSPPRLWVFEPNRRRMSGFDLTGRPRSAGTIQLHSARMLDDVKFLEGGIAVGIGLFQDRGVLIIADSTMVERVRYFGEVPYHTSQFPPVMIFDANRSSLAVSRARGRIAVAYMYFPAIDVFDSTGLFVTRWSSPTKIGFPRRPAADPNPDFSVVASDLAFTRVAATDSGVFAVECSCPGASRDTAGSWIDSFSWDRGLLWRVHVPEFVTAVAASRDGTRLFLGVNDPEPRVIPFLVANW